MTHSRSEVYLHITFATKHRRPLLLESFRDQLHLLISAAVADSRSTVVAVNSVEDHIHLLIRLSRTVSVADLVESLKKKSSRWVKKTFPEVRDFRWQTGYAVFSVGPSRVHQVVRYIENQREHHRKMSCDQEIELLLRYSNLTQREPSTQSGDRSAI